MNNKKTIQKQQQQQQQINMATTVYYAFCWLEGDKWRTSENRFHTDTTGMHRDVKMGQFLRDTWFRKTLDTHTSNRFAIVSVNLYNLTWYGPSISKHISNKLNKSPNEFKFTNDQIYRSKTGDNVCTLKDIWRYEISESERVTITKDLFQTEDHERFYLNNTNDNEIDYKLSFAFNLIKEKSVPKVRNDVENYTLMICAPQFNI
tara:strand:+ start:118 stop:729 length:612 start_codon:yes stop_codon:yes gene_type:complete